MKYTKSSLKTTFREIIAREDYDPDLFTYENKSINQAVQICYPVNVKEEFLLIDIDSNSNNADTYSPFEKGVQVFMKQGTLFHDIGFKKAPRTVMIWQKELEKFDYPLALKIKPLKKQGITETRILFMPSLGDPSDKRVNHLLFYGSSHMERITSHKYRVTCSANNSNPNYSDFIYEISSVIMPLDGYISTL